MESPETSQVAEVGTGLGAASDQLALPFGRAPSGPPSGPAPRPVL